MASPKSPDLFQDSSPPEPSAGMDPLFKVPLAETAQANGIPVATVYGPQDMSVKQDQQNAVVPDASGYETEGWYSDISGEGADDEGTSIGPLCSKLGGVDLDDSLAVRRKRKRKNKKSRANMKRRILVRSFSQQRYT